jgi:mono/diheme cytochrome c family protein
MRTLIPALAMAMLIVSSCSSSPAEEKKDDVSATKKLEGDALVQRGNYLVTIASCNDCHSPKNMTPMGPVADSTKLFSGHPANMPLPPIDPNALKPGGWINMAPDVTAFVGPWGISYAANLTPDSATGIGAWTEEVFIKTLRTGKHLGMDNGRPILPPMPWNYVSQMTDEDLSAVYAYLKSLPAISNRVPAPVPPDQAAAKK